MKVLGRRAFLATVSGAAAAVAGCSSSSTRSPTPTETEDDHPYPYWRHEWSVDDFHVAQTRWDDIQVHLILDYEGDGTATWPGSIRARNRDQPDYTIIMPQPQSDKGEKADTGVNIWPWIDAKRGEYTVDIVGTEHVEEGVFVEGIE